MSLARATTQARSRSQISIRHMASDMTWRTSKTTILNRKHDVGQHHAQTMVHMNNHLKNTIYLHDFHNLRLLSSHLIVLRTLIKSIANTKTINLKNGVNCLPKHDSRTLMKRNANNKTFNLKIGDNAFPKPKLSWKTPIQNWR